MLEVTFLNTREKIQIAKEILSKKYLFFDMNNFLDEKLCILKNVF